MDAVLGLYGSGRRLGDDGQGARLPAVDVGAVVEDDAVRRLRQVRAQADLVALRARHGPQGGLHAGELDEPLLEGLDRGVAFFVVDVIVYGCLQDGLAGRKGKRINTGF